MKKYTYLLLLVLLQTVFSTIKAFGQIYVKHDAGGSNNGSTWADAYTDLQDALDHANATQIWVAAGTYKPKQSPDGTSTTPSDRNNAFHLATDKQIYGGFAGTETLLSQRNWVTNKTILSGDFNGDDVVTVSGTTLTFSNNSENAYHVFITANLTNAAIIDGFTIQGGNANSSGGISYAGNGYGKNGGGGLFIRSSSATLNNLIFSNNSGTNSGGGIYIINSSPIINNSIFKNNLALLGGGLYTTGSSTSTIITNSTFFNNNAGVYGGGVRQLSGTLNIKNSIFWNNKKNGDAAIAGADIEGSGLTISHSLTQANSTYSSGDSIINNQDPLFVDANYGNFRLFRCSPAINKGTANGAPSTDFLGLSRVGAPDMGAYEYQGVPFSTAIYVNKNATGNNDGSTWTNAYTDLQTAMDAHCGSFDIWVAGGTYKPTQRPDGDASSLTDRDNAFHLARNMKIYGGFAGTETQLSQRNWVTNKTILSGDFNGDDVVTVSGTTLTFSNNTENAYHVFLTENLTNAAIIDGFTIQGGNANSSGNISTYGGDFIHFNGGGLYNISSSPTLNNLTFVNNSATISGGGMHNYYSSTIISNSTFYNNNAGSFGGGMGNSSSSPIISNSTFFNNNAGSFGGGMENSSSDLTIVNSTFFNNSANFGGGMQNNSSSYSFIKNSIFWNNKKNGNAAIAGADIEGSSHTISHSLTQENSTYSSGTGIINNQDPQFVDAANRNFRLRPCSPAINTGTSAGTPASDFLGLSRVGVPDMGAYEYQGAANPAVIYVNKNATGSNDGSTWTNAFTDLQTAMDAQCGTADVWVAAGTYLPTKDHTGNSNPTNQRDKNFHLAKDMKIYGGFADTETQLSQRNWVTNKTILSGDFDGNDLVTGGGATLNISNNSENAYHVFITANLTNAALIDGFTIQGGNANVSSTIIFANKTYWRDSGGGLSNINSSPTLNNLTFLNNRVHIFGGGMFNFMSSPIINNSIFKNNMAGFGGGMYNEYSSPIMANSTFFNNNAGSFGGGMNNSLSSPIITNSTFVNNDASGGGGGIYYNSTINAIIKNSIFWNNKKNNNAAIAGADIEGSGLTISHSLTQVYGTGTDIIKLDPQFVDAANGLLQLKCNSPAINQGNSENAPLNDITGFLRSGNPDMGAYEYGHAEVINAIPNASNPNLSGTPTIKASSQILNTNNVLYQGMNNVQLLPGFSVAPALGQATVFRAEIGGGGCN